MARKRKKKKNPNDKRRQEFTYLDEETIERVAKKEWKKQKPVFSTDPSKDKRLKNLTGPKTEEGKRRSLQNLRPAPSKKQQEELKEIRAQEGGHLYALMTPDEVSFYNERKEKYVKDFELNESSDEALLRSVLMEELTWYRLMKRQAEKPTASLDKPLNDCMKRLRESLKALGVTREQRQGFNVNIRASVAELVERVEREIHADEQLMKELDEEEERLLAEKREREQNMIVDADFEVILDELEVLDDEPKEEGEGE